MRARVWTSATSVSGPPPSKWITSSAVPWTWATDTGALGVQSVGSAKVSPATLTMAATRSARSQAIRYDMNPPFEWPTNAIRFGSMASLPWISAMTLDR